MNKAYEVGEYGLYSESSCATRPYRSNQWKYQRLKLVEVFIKMVVIHISICYAAAGKVLWQKMVKSPFHWVIYPSAQPDEANQQQQKKKIVKSRLT